MAPPHPHLENKGAGAAAAAVARVAAGAPLAAAALEGAGILNHQRLLRPQGRRPQQRDRLRAAPLAGAAAAAAARRPPPRAAAAAAAAGAAAPPAAARRARRALVLLGAGRAAGISAIAAAAAVTTAFDALAGSLLAPLRLALPAPRRRLPVGALLPPPPPLLWLLSGCLRLAGAVPQVIGVAQPKGRQISLLPIRSTSPLAAAAALAFRVLSRGAALVGAPPPRLLLPQLPRGVFRQRRAVFVPQHGPRAAAELGHEVGVI